MEKTANFNYIGGPRPLAAVAGADRIQVGPIKENVRAALSDGGGHVKMCSRDLARERFV